jgi:hypothetical protein
MPLLHWYSYSFLERIFNCVADFATDIGNGNVISESHPITELNRKALFWALTVMKTFCDQINLHQVTMTPTMVMSGAVTAYTVSPWNNTQACRPPKDDKNFSLADGAFCSNSNAYSTFKQRCGDKCNPAIPDGIDENLCVPEAEEAFLHGKSGYPC